MEHEEPPAETSDDPKLPSTTPEEERQQTTTHTPKSYECNFCKRGFTNAQALGGHMNIHRKNKVKIKQSTSSTPPNAAVESPSPTRPRLSTTTSSAANPSSISHQGSRYFTSTLPQDEKKPLPLFSHRDTTIPMNIHQENQPGNPPLPDRQVDLELRLGQAEPPPSESSPENKTATTRKFF